MTDPYNCGTCGHGCLNGTCSGGVCQAFHVEGEQGPQVFDATSTGYYEASNTDIEHVSTTGGFGTGGSYTDIIGTDGFAVWSTPAGTITTGGPHFDSPVAVPVPAGHAPMSLALAAYGVAWTDSSGNLLAYDFGTKTTQIVANTGLDSPGLCAVSTPAANQVFFELATGNVFRWDGVHPNDASGITRVAAGSAAMTDDANTLYLGDPSGVVSSVPAMGGALTTLTKASAPVVSLALDFSGGLYILTTTGLERYDLASGNVSALSSVGAGAGSGCHALAVAPTEVVWSAEVQGAYAIWGIAR